MMRGTFGNIRLRNQLAPGTEGGWTLCLQDGEKMPIYDAAVKYREAGVPLLVIAGKECGSGSSRDWAAKGTRLLGVRAVIAESFFFQAEDGIRDDLVTGVQTCALPI